MSQARATGSATPNGHELGDAAGSTPSASLARPRWHELAGQVQRASRGPTSTSATPTTSASSSRCCGCSSSLWFRGEVRGLGNIPDDGPVLLVGNHSGGNMIPDTGVFTLAFSTYFGVERPFYQLAHNLVLSLPGLGFLRKFGTVAASPENAERRCAPGAALLVYPGGDHEVHRPSWEGNRGRLRRAARASCASRSSRTCRSCRWSRSAARRPRCSSPAASASPGCCALDRLLRLKVLPISLALPWGVNVGDFGGHIPLPAKITVEMLPAIDLREEFGEDPDVDEVYDQVIRLMQDTLDALAAERRLPVLG